MEGSDRLLNWKHRGIKSWNRLNAMLAHSGVLQAAGSHRRFLSKGMARIVLVLLCLSVLFVIKETRMP